MYFFFFSSRSRHTRWPRDWSSDVCSSDLGTGGPSHVRVVGEGRAEAGVVVEHGRVEVAEVGEDRIEADHRVALGENEAVAVGPIRPRGVNPKRVVIEDREEIGAGEGAGVVAVLRDIDQIDGPNSDELGALFLACPEVCLYRHLR